MYPSARNVIPILVLCFSLAACMKPTDNVAAPAPVTTVVTTPSQTKTNALIKRTGTFDSDVITVAGVVKQINNKPTLGGRSLIGDEENAEVNAVFDAPGETTLLLSIGGMGSSCPSLYMFLTLKSDGSILKTDTFGTCSDIPKVVIFNNLISVSMSKMNGDGEDTWTYSNTTLSKASSVEAPNTERPAKLAFEQDVPFKIRGALVKNSDKWTLKLPKQVILTGCAIRDNHVKELSLSSAPLKDAAKAVGERDFDVKIFCLGGASPQITELALPGALDVAVPAPAPTVASTLPGGTVVQIKVGGVACSDLDSMKAFIETSKPGRCSVSQQVSIKTQVLNTQTNTPGWVFIKITNSVVALIRLSDLLVAEAAPAPAPQAEVSRGSFVAEGTTICTNLRSMIRTAAMLRVGHLSGLSDDCMLTPNALRIRVIGDSPMPGISVVQVGVDQAFVRSEDVTYQ